MKWLTKLYRTNELRFALVWIMIYVIAMNIGLQFAGGKDNLADKQVWQVLVPLSIGAVLAAVATVWIIRSDLREKFGLCAFRGSWRSFLFFIPLLVMSMTNLTNGIALEAALSVSLLMALNKMIAGYLEEVIFRGFLFRAMQKDSLRSAIIVSAVTFGVGHTVNLLNTADTLSVLLQIGYAIAIGFLYTIIVYKGGSMWPCILSHMLINGSSSFSAETGAFSHLVETLTGQATPQAEQICSAALLILIAGGYALWLWFRTENLPERA